MFEKIVWATDGSQAADAALPVVKDIAATHGAAIVALHSEELLVGPGAHGAPLSPGGEELQQKVKGQVDELVGEGLDATFRVVGGPSVYGAAHHLAEAAGEEGADLIVAGTRGHTPLGALVVGSVTQRLLHIARCPVLVVPARLGAKRAPAAAEAPGRMSGVLAD